MVELYDRIKKCISRDIFSSQKSLNECVMNIYLTASNARLGCFPFDGDSQISGRKMHDMLIDNPSSLKCLVKNVPEIGIKIGGYYDNGNDVVAIYNKDREDEALPLLKKIKHFKRYKHNIVDRKQSFTDWAELHILIGTFLGYPVPSDMIYDREVYLVEFLIDGNRHLASICDINMQNIKKCLFKLEEIKKAIDIIDERVVMTIEINYL